jgi:hypothetical protein
MDVLGLRPMGPRGSWLSRLLLACGFALSLSGMSASSALAGGSAGPLTGYGSPPRSNTCAGTPEEPGVLAGVYFGHVTVEGSCLVDGGEAVVHGELKLRPGSLLLAAFAHNDVGGSGSSDLRVLGDVRVEDGATLLLGCEAEHFPCIDDPEPEHPTLSSRDRVYGDLREHRPLGVVVHDSVIGGDVTETGGGGGLGCEPSGPFAAFKSPVFSDYEDTLVHGDLEIAGLRSCWLGLARLEVGGDVRLSNDQLADPDAIEIIDNEISGNLKCKLNSRVWDSSEETGEGLFPRKPEPNSVHGKRSGQCVLASPSSEGGPLGPGPF